MPETSFRLVNRITGASCYGEKVAENYDPGAVFNSILLSQVFKALLAVHASTLADGIPRLVSECSHAFSVTSQAGGSRWSLRRTFPHWPNQPRDTRSLAEFSAPVQRTRKRSPRPKLLAVRRINVGFGFLPGRISEEALNANCSAALPKPAPIVWNVFCQTSSDSRDSPIPERCSRAGTRS